MMGYFSNGTEGDMYHDKWCKRCIHDNEEKEIYCPVWDLHLINNYEECNKKDSFLHRLIPRDGINNLKCTMFVDRGCVMDAANGP